MSNVKAIALIWLAFLPWMCFSQETEEEYDFDNLEYAGTGGKTYANPKIFGLSPQRFISIGYDHLFAHDMKLSSIGSFADDDPANINQINRVRSQGGLRVGLMVPLISKTRFLWQMAANYWEVGYNMQVGKMEDGLESNNLGRILNERGLRTTNWINTFYVPLDDKQFILFQAQTDLSGDYRLSEFQPLKFVRYSAAALWGKRPHDRKQWGVGISRTYRVGNMNYIPVLMYNYTSVNRKWGTEILFPARAHVRYTRNPRSLFLIGYELEGQSYRIGQLSDANRSFEIRRGELRPRIDYQTQLYGFFWLGLQAGVRMDYSFDADYLPDNREFFRGFFGTQPFAMKNNLGMAPYLNLSINFVSP